MKKEHFEKTVKMLKIHTGIMLSGLVRTIYGSLIAGMIGFAIYGFIRIKAEGGYAAVFDFVASCAVLVIALANAYLLGGKKRGNRK